MTEATAKLRVVIESVDFEQGTRVVKRNLDEIASRANSAMSALDRINKSLNILKTVAGAYLSFRGIKSMVDQLIDASKSLEDYRMTMRAVIHDAGEADEAFERIKKWAAQNPVDTDEAIKAFTMLNSAALGTVDDVERATKSLGNLAAVAHTSIDHAASALIMANNRSLRPFGIQIENLGDQVIVKSGEVRVKVGKDLESIRKGIVELIDARYPNAMSIFGDTYSVLWKTLGGMKTELFSDMMGYAAADGPFQKLKDTLIETRDTWQDWVKSDDYKVFIKDFRKSATDAFGDVKDIVQALTKLTRTLATNIDKVVSALKGLAAFKLTKGMLLLLGMTNPAAMAVAIGAGLITYGSDQSPATAAQDYERLLRESIKNIKTVIEQNKIEIDANSGIFGNLSLAEQLKKENEGLDFQLREYYRLLDKAQAPLAALGKLSDPIPKDPDEDNKKLRRRGTLDILKDQLAGYRNRVKYLGEDAASFLPLLDKMQAKLPLLSDGWIMVQDAIDDFTKQGKARIKELSDFEENQLQLAVSHEDWRYSVGLTSAEDYFKQLVARYAETQKELRNLGPLPTLPGEEANIYFDKFGNLQSRRQKEYSGLQGMAEFQAEELLRQIDEGSMSWSRARQAVSGYVRALKDAGIEGGDALKTITDKCAEADKQMEILRQSTVGWIHDFQSGFVDAIVEGERFGDVLSHIGKQIEKMALNLALFGSNGTGGLFGGVFDSILKVFSPKVPGISAPIPGFDRDGLFARGGAFIDGIIPFADGGIVSSPTLFRFAHGTAMGLMGEAGPEAIMPLRRTPGGDLGVIAQGTKGGVVVNNNISVTTEGGSGDEEETRKTAKLISDMVEEKTIRTIYELKRSNML